MRTVGLLAILLGVVAIGLITAAPGQLVTPKPTPAPTNPVVSVPRPTTTPGLSVASFSIVSMDSRWDYGTLYAIGEVKNNGPVAAGVELEFAARDATGRLVDSQTFWPAVARNIPPGDTTGFRYSITNNATATGLTGKIVSVHVFR